ncbi:MAG: MalY/PatB family protein [Bacteroidales bacterium]
MKYTFDTPYQRKNTNCVKFDLADSIYQNKNIIPMWVADMDFQTAPEVIDYLRERIDHGIFGYSFLSREYYNSIKNWVKNEHNWDIGINEICFSPGVVPAIYFILQTFSKEKDKIAIQTPVYFMFQKAINDTGRIITDNPLTQEELFYSINFNDLEKKFQSGTKIFLLCNPQNPTGRVFTAEELLKIGELAVKYNVLIFSDEIHYDLIRPNHKHIPIASLSEKISQQTITAISASKSFNLNGLNTASVIIKNPKLREKYNSFVKKIHINSPNTFGHLATYAALTQGKSWLKELNKYLHTNHNFIADYCAKNIPQVQVCPSEATFLTWLNFDKLKFNQKELVNFINHNCNLGLSSGTDFGSNGKGFMRMNIACPKTTLKKALENLESGVNNLQ